MTIPVRANDDMGHQGSARRAIGRDARSVDSIAVSAIDTPATIAARDAGLRFDVVEMDRPPTSAEDSAAMQGIAIEDLLRTIVLRRAADDYLFVLVPGGLQIDWPKLRAHLGVRKLSLPDQDEAQAATGYERGAITPFGSAHAWPVVADASIDPDATVAIGGGRRGLNLHLRAGDLFAAVGAEVADVTVGGS
jgi:Cys-tRNA(Pro) deacylase